VPGGFLKYLHEKEQWPSSFVARDMCENSVGRPSVLDFWVYFQSVLKSVTVCEAPVDRIRRHLAAVERRLEVPPRRLKDFFQFLSLEFYSGICALHIARGTSGKINKFGVANPIFQYVHSMDKWSSGETGSYTLSWPMQGIAATELQQRSMREAWERNL